MQQPSDGRAARGQRSREAIVSAMLSLIREGVVRPSTTQIADRAGVTQRTLFNHFADVPSLMGEVASAQVEFVSRNMPRPPIPPCRPKLGRYNCSRISLTYLT